MALPSLRILDAVLGLTDVARRLNQRSIAGALQAPDERLTTRQGSGSIETRLAGVVVAALKEAFDRDNQRLQFEREQREADRKRAERLLTIELARQSGDRELNRLRWLAGAAAASWLATLLFSVAVTNGSMGLRAMFGVGWLLLLVALAISLIAQSRVASTLARLDVTVSNPHAPEAAAAGTAAAWLLVSGLAVIAVAVLLR